MRFSKQVLCLMVSLLGSGVAVADDGLKEFAKQRDVIVNSDDWLSQAQEILSMTQELAEGQEHAEAQDFFAEHQATQPSLAYGQDLAKAKDTISWRVLIFASRSLGNQGIDDILEVASASPDTAVVFRGLPPEFGVDIEQGVFYLQEMGNKKSPVPNILLDPTLFEEFGVNTVPSIVMLEEGREIARVQGLSDPTWIGEQRGDLGIKGDVREIEEPDLIALMQQKALQIDWEQQKEAALNNFWQKQQFNELPPAKVSRTRTLDPSLVVTADIKDADGKVLVAQGTAINPLDVRDFNEIIVVFDPLDKRQLPRIRERLPQVKKDIGNFPVTWIATRLDREKGWDSHVQISDELDEHVYLLPTDVRDRFQIKHTPTILFARDKKFEIVEIGLGEDTP